MRRSLLLLLLLVLGSACSSTSTSGDAAVEGGIEDGDVRDAGGDAGGVCCPITASSGCSGVDVYIGGWAPSMADCHTTTWFDGYPMTPTTDARGCPVLREDRTQTPCGQPRIDAGRD